MAGLAVLTALVALASPAQASLETELSNDPFTSYGSWPNWQITDSTVEFSGTQLRMEFTTTSGSNPTAAMRSYPFAVDLTPTTSAIASMTFGPTGYGTYTYPDYYYPDYILKVVSSDGSKWVKISCDRSSNCNYAKVTDSLGGSHQIDAYGTIGRSYKLEVFSDHYVGTYSASDSSGTTTESVTSSVFNGVTAAYVEVAESRAGSGGILGTSWRDNIVIKAKLPADIAGPTASGGGTTLGWTNAVPSLSGAGWQDINSGIASGSYSVGSTSGATDRLGWTALAVKVSGNPTTVPAGYAMRWPWEPVFTPSGLGQGWNYVNLQATDKAGNTATASTAYVVKYDTNGPTVSGAPNVGAWVKLAPTLGSVGFTDPYSGLANNAEYSIGSTSGATDRLAWTSMPVQPSVGQTTAWTPSWTPSGLADGANYVNVRVRDTLGNVATHNGAYVVSLDAALPTVTGAPNAYPWTNAVPSLGGVTWSDAPSGLQSAQYSIGPTSGSTSTLGWTNLPQQPTPGSSSWTPAWTPSTLAQGTNHVNVRVTDRAGNTATTNGAYTVDYDTGAPTVAGSAPTLGWTNTVPSLSGRTWSDSRSGFAASAEYSIGLVSGSMDYLTWTAMPAGSGPTLGSASWSPAWTPASLGQGTNHVHIRVRDVAGNVAVTTNAYIVKYDTLGPGAPTIVSSTHPESGAYYQATTAVLSWTMLETGSGEDGVSWDWVTDTGTGLDSTKDLEETATSRSFPGLGPFSHHYFRVRGIDNAGNVGPVSVYEVGVDTIKPVAESQFPIGVSSDPFVEVGARYDDPDGGFDSTPRKTPVDVARVVLKVDGVSIKTAYSALCSPTGPLCQYQVTPTQVRFKPLAPWSDGVHNVELTLGDTVSPSNEQTFAWSFTVLSAEDPDVDDDGVPDDLEATICDEENPGLAADGSCAGDDWTAPTPEDLNGEAGELVDSVEETLDSLDLDDDGVPDAVEPVLCAEEQPAVASDGSCNAARTDWTAPGSGAAGQDAATVLALAEDAIEGLDGDGDAVPDLLEPILCAQQNPFLNADGQCTGSDWTKPTAEGIVADVLFLLGL